MSLLEEAKAVNDESVAKAKRERRERLRKSAAAGAETLTERIGATAKWLRTEAVMFMQKEGGHTWRGSRTMHFYEVEDVTIAVSPDARYGDKYFYVTECERDSGDAFIPLFILSYTGSTLDKAERRARFVAELGKATAERAVCEDHKLADADAHCPRCGHRYYDEEAD